MSSTIKSSPTPAHTTSASATGQSSIQNSSIKGQTSLATRVSQIKARFFADIKYRSQVSTSVSESSSASLPSLSTSAQQSAPHVSSMASNFPRSHCTGNSIISSSVASSTALSRILVRVTIASISTIPSHRHSCKQYHTKHFPCNHDSSYQ